MSGYLQYYDMFRLISHIQRYHSIFSTRSNRGHTYSRTCLRLHPKTAITSKQFETVRLAALYGHVATYPSCQWTLCHSCKHPRRSRCPRGLRPLACWGCGFESRRGDMEIEVCASDLSLVQRSPTEWICVTECDQVH